MFRASGRPSLESFLGLGRWVAAEGLNGDWHFVLRRQVFSFHLNSWLGEISMKAAAKRTARTRSLQHGLCHSVMNVWTSMSRKCVRTGTCRVLVPVRKDDWATCLELMKAAKERGLVGAEHCEYIFVGSFQPQVWTILCSWWWRRNFVLMPCVGASCSTTISSCLPIEWFSCAVCRLLLQQTATQSGGEWEGREKGGRSNAAEWEGVLQIFHFSASSTWCR